MYLKTEQTKAVKLVSEWVAVNYPESENIGTNDDRLANTTLNAWLIPLSLKEVDHLILIIDEEFPYSMPRVMISGTDISMQWPHVEKNGMLCLAGDSAAISTDDPISVIENVLHESECLLHENASGLNIDDYQNDFSAYWRRAIPPNAPQFQIRLNQTEPSRLICAWHGKNYYLIGEDSNSLLTWLENLSGSDACRSIHPAAVIWLTRLPEPSTYPETTNQLRNLIKKHSSDGINVFDQLIKQENFMSAVILMGKAPNAVTQVFGYRLDRPAREMLGKRTGSRSYQKGFREGKIPPSHLANYFKCQRTTISNVDELESRLQSTITNGLRNKKVIIIGCGSVGSSVALHLVKTGVRRLHLIDPDSLMWENLGRHELGANDIGNNKALGLANRLKAKLPHIKECGHSPESWIKAYKLNSGLFKDADLVISTTADWNTESALNDIQCQGEIPCPVLYGWLEPFACASHALLSSGTNGCLRCGFDSTGRAKASTTLWTTDFDQHGCGGGKSIYGSIELAQAATLISQLAIDSLLNTVKQPIWRTWIAPKISVIVNGGLWNPEWCKLYGDPEGGGLLTSNRWPKSTSQCICEQGR